MHPAKYSQLLGRLQDALRLYPGVAAWEGIRDKIIAAHSRPDEPGTPTQWYRMPRMKNRLVCERQALEQCLDDLTLELSLPSDKLVARGMVALAHETRIAFELIFPCDFPSSSPKLFLIGPGVRSQLGDLLRGDESIPVPAGRDQHWGPDMTSDQIVRWGRQWLQDNTVVLRG